MNSKSKLNILIIYIITMFALGCVSNDNNLPTEKNINEYSKEDMAREKDWHRLDPEDVIISKSESKSIIKKFYAVQKTLILKNQSIKYNNYLSNPLSELIREYDPEFAADPNSTGRLNENNIIIVRKKNIDFADSINNPTENMLYLYSKRAEPLLVIDDRTLLIKYANFGGYDYSYRNIEYIE
jgi:hypothetical protein